MSENKRRDIVTYLKKHCDRLYHTDFDKISIFNLNDDVINDIYQFIFIDQNENLNIDPFIKGFYSECEEDYEKMKYYYKMSIDAGNIYAMNNLGIYYYRVEKDYEKMEQYYEMAIDKKCSGAMLNLGIYYKTVKKDYEMMKYYYEMSIDHGNVDAMDKLGYYYHGIKNYEKFKYYYEMVIDKGYSYKIGSLKSYYENHINFLTGDQLIDAIEFYMKHKNEDLYIKDHINKIITFFNKLITNSDLVITQRFTNLLLLLDGCEEYKLPIVKFLVNCIKTQVDLMECHYKFQLGGEGFEEAKNDYFSRLISGKIDDPQTKSKNILSNIKN